MAEQVLIQFSADRDLKEICAGIYEKMGIDLNTAFQIFMERTKDVKGFPFSVHLEFSEKKISYSEALVAFHELRKQAKDVPEMSIDEINAEISAVRTEKRRNNAILCGD